MIPQFFSSSILRFGPIFTPFRIEINDNHVLCTKNDGISSLFLTTTRVFLNKKKITNYSIIDNFFWCDIRITTSSGEYIYFKHFTMDDAINIQKLII